MYKIIINSFIKFLEENYGITVDEFIELAKRNRIEAKKIVYDYKEYLASKLAPKTLSTYLSVLNSWLDFHEVGIRVRRRNNSRVTPISLDYIPSLDELEYILSKASHEYRAIFSLIAFSGLRPSDVVSLRYRNIMTDIDYDPEKKLYYAKRVPAVIELRQEKTGQWHVTFMGPKAVRALLDWLNILSREILRRRLRLDDKLFIDKTTKKIDDYWLYLLKRLGIPRIRGFRHFRVYSLRKYFRRAVSRLGEDTAEYLLGHLKGINSLSAIYSGLRDLDPQAIEQLRQSFATIVEDLEGSAIGTREIIDEVRRLKEELNRLRKQNELLVKLIEQVFMGLPHDDWLRVADYINELLYQRTKEELGETLEQAFIEAINLSRRLRKKPT